MNPDMERKKVIILAVVASFAVVVTVAGGIVLLRKRASIDAGTSPDGPAETGSATWTGPGNEYMPIPAESDALTSPEGSTERAIFREPVDRLLTDDEKRAYGYPATWKVRMTSGRDEKGLFSRISFSVESTGGDSDADRLTDEEETKTYDTDPKKQDTDGDGLGDYDEVIIFDTDPNKKDTDGDGIHDKDEISQKRDPLDPTK